MNNNFIHSISDYCDSKTKITLYKMGDLLEPSTQNIGYFNLEASTVD